MTSIPLLHGHSHDSIIAYRQGQAVTASQFLSHAQQLADALPGHAMVLNLCEDRYHFMRSFVAALMRGQVTLLPPNRTTTTIEQLMQEHEDSYVITDKAEEYAGFRHTDCTTITAESTETTTDDIPAEQTCAILYTSGSSGIPEPHTKSWGMLAEGARLTGNRLGIKSGATLLATVPPQHMFGLETSVMLPLQQGCAISDQRPLFPADIIAGLEQLPQRRALITTPLQLRACATAQQPLPRCEFILSATAPLSSDLAQQVEAQSGSPVQEIYGSTETGAIATRRTASDEYWHPLPGVQFSQDSAQHWQVTATHLLHAQPLADELWFDGDRFSLLGRNSDLIKIAGKRASLGDLNHLLLSIPGVRDGVFFLPATDSGQRTPRLAAAVEWQLDSHSLIQALQERLDAAFMPRPLIIVDKLPRNETGKLPHHALMGLLDRVEA